MSTSTAPARSAGRQRDERTDAALIAAVLDLVSAGATLSGLSFVAIAEHAGVSRNSLYRRWKIKEALYIDVLASVNRPVPVLAGRSVREDIVKLLSALIERTLDTRAMHMLRALNAESGLFPQLHRRYFDEIVAPRREAMLAVLRRGTENGGISREVDLDLASDVLVAPILSRMASGITQDLDPVTTSWRIADLVFTGLAPR
jgi:AcrR family transcriptional regulator